MLVMPGTQATQGMLEMPATLEMQAMPVMPEESDLGPQPESLRLCLKLHKKLLRRAPERNDLLRFGGMS